MSVEGKGFRVKSPEELKAQVETADSYAQDVFGTSLVPSATADIDSLVDLSGEYLYETHPYRMDLYRDILTHQDINQAFPSEEVTAYSKRLRVLNAIDRYISEHYSDEDPTLYEPQIRVLEDLRDALEKGETEGYFKLPTSFGKTVIFTEFIEAIGLKTLIVVPTLDTLDQSDEALETFAPEVTRGLVYQDRKDFGEQATIITYTSFINQLRIREQNPDEAQLDPDEYDLLILDEVHRSLTPLRSDAVNQFSNAIKLGFSATPYRSPERDARKLLKNEISSITIQEGVQSGRLANFKVWLAHTDVDLSNVKVHMTTVGEGEYVQRELVRAVDVKSRNQAAVDLYKQYFEGEVGIVYCGSIEHAQKMAEVYQQNGISAAAVWGEMDINERRRILRAHKRGEIKILTGKNVLIEGYDNKRVSVIFNLQPTLSPVVAEQRGGRALRIDRENPNKEATIIDFIDRDSRKQYSPVTFAEVAGAARVERAVTDQYPLITSELKDHDSGQVFVDGLVVVTSVEEIMRVVSEAIDIRERQALPYGDYQFVSPVDFAAEYNVNRITIHRDFKKLAALYPNLLMLTPSGRLYALPEGVSIVENLLREKYSTNFLPVIKAQLAEKYRVPLSTVHSRVYSVKKIYPDEFILRANPSGTGIVLHATQRGLELIEKQFQPKHPSKYRPLDIGNLSIRYSMPRNTVYKVVRDLRKEMPDAIFGGRGGGNSYVATREAQRE